MSKFVASYPSFIPLSRSCQINSGALSLRQDRSATVSNFQIIAAAFPVFLKRRAASVRGHTALKDD